LITSLSGTDLLRFHRHFASQLCLAVLLAVGAAACGGAPASAPPKVAQRYPFYDEQAARLFDDHIDGNAVGLADIAGNPRTDPIFRARTQSAELVGRVRVLTVTTDLVGGKPLYRVNLAFMEPPLVRRGIDEDHLEIAVHSTSSSFGVVKWLDVGIIGRTFIGFFRRYAQGEEPALRFHLSADTPLILAAAREADMLGELSGK
jgi:hypothetical protein